MSQKYVIKFLLLLASFLLVLKPIFGFSLYEQGKNRSQYELITIIKAFSKRKQEYNYDANMQSEYVPLDSMRKAVYIALSFLLFGFGRSAPFFKLNRYYICSRGAAFLYGVRLYLAQGKLVI